jgi:hypothetical protein
MLTKLIAFTLFTLAAERRGALVVFPGREPIQEWISGGYLLDAQPSAPLLRSIFDPHSPGHDGALIVEKGRFARLGVRLPISQRQQLSDDYGTRHHAAMGLAEKSDALTILVSEERGQVSIFSKGKMQTFNKADELFEAIICHWKETASYPFAMTGKRAHRGIISQLVASFALAFVFWSTLVIAQGEQMEKIVTVPVEFSVSPSDLVLVGDKDKEVRLHLSGSRSDFNVINSTDLKARIDLTKAVAGKQTFVITDQDVRLPRGINLLDVVPPSIDLTLAKLAEVEIPIKAQFVGKLPAELKIQSVEVKPNRVRVLSPPSQKAFEKVMTTPIYLESITDHTTIYCKIIAPPALHPVEKHWPDVEVTITVAR